MPNNPQQPHKPPHAPVRPAALDGPRDEQVSNEPLAETPSARVAGSRPASPASPAMVTIPRRVAADVAHPCARCGYDLRGLPSGGRCPECSAAIPKRRRVIPESKQAVEVRHELAAGWRGLSEWSLAPIVLLTPFPFLLPFGAPVAAAVGFAPIFRLMALRKFELLPDSIGDAWRPELARLRTLIAVEVTFTALVWVFSLAGTFSMIPAGLVPAYFALLILWWVVSMVSISQQLRAGHLLALRLVDPAVLPSIGRARWAAALGPTLAILALGAFTFALVGAPAGTMQTATGLVGYGSLLLAAIAGGYACVSAFGHAPMVAECIHEAELLGAPRRIRPGEPDDDDALPPSAPIDPPDADGRPAWEREDRIPLA